MSGFSFRRWGNDLNRTANRKPSSRSSGPARKRLRPAPGRRIVFEQLESRALLSLSTTVITDGAPHQIPLDDAKAGQVVPLVPFYDPYYKDALRIWTSAGDSWVYPYVFGVKQLVKLKQDGEKIWGQIIGYQPGHGEMATIKAGDRTITVKASFSDFQTSFQAIADDIQKAEQVIEQLIMLSAPGWQFSNVPETTPKVEGGVSGTVSIAPDGSIDGGSVAVDGSVSVSDTAELYWGLPAHIAGVSVSLKASIGLGWGVKVAWNPAGEAEFSGEIKPDLSGTISGNLYAGFYKGFVAGTASLTFPIVVSPSSGMASGGIDLGGSVNGAIQFKGFNDKSYHTVGAIPTYSFPTRHLLEWQYDVGAMVQQAVQNSKNGQGEGNGSAALAAVSTDAAAAGFAAGPLSLIESTPPLLVAENTQAAGDSLNADPAVTATHLVVTSKPPSTITAGSPFGLVVTAEDDSGHEDTSFDGSVTVSDASETPGGTTTVTAVDGVATFSGLTLDKAGTYQYLVVSAAGLFDGATNYFTVEGLPASQLAFADTLGPFGVGSTFDVQVSAEDSYGNVDPNFSGNVTVALATNPAGATLGGTLTVAANNGVADFSTLSIDKLGTGYALGASSGGSGLTSATSPAFDVTDNLVIATEPPGSITAGAPLGLVVKIENGPGSVDTSFNGSVTVSDASQSLGGTTTVNAVAGVATFSGLALYQADRSQEYLEVSASGSPSVDTHALAVTAAAATQLVLQPIGTQPLSDGEAPYLWAGENSYVTRNAPFNVVVDAEDPYGNVDGTYSGSVTLALAANPSGATLGGTLTVAASAGVATFSNMRMDKLGAGYTLVAKGSALTGTSGFFDVADQLAITTSAPSSVTAGEPFGLVVEAQDGAGNLDTSFNGNITVLNNGTGTLLQGASIVQAVRGVATFSGLTADEGGSFIDLACTSDGLGFASQPVTVTTATAAQLVATTEPSSLTAGSPFTVEISAEDPFGNIDYNYSGSVTLALLNNPGGGTLGGTLTATAVSGTATFSGLTLANPGSGYTLQATASALSSATTTPFNVTAAGVATQLVVSSPPPKSVTAGSPFGLVVEAEDDSGALDTSFSGSVTLALLNNSGSGTLGGTLTVPAVGGVATFSGLTLDTASFGYMLQASSGSLAAATTGFVGVTPAAATQFMFVGPFVNVLSGSPFDIAVEAVDPYGNIDPTYSGSVTLSLANNPGGATLDGTFTATANAGIADFPDLTIDQPGIGATLQANGGGLPAGTSSAFNVTGDQLAVTLSPPSGIAAGATFGLTVAAKNASGNVDASFSGPVTVGMINFSGNGATLGGTLTATAAGGVAIFSGLTVNQVGSYALSVSAGGAAPTATGIFNVTATQLTVSTQPPAEVNARAPFSLTVTAGDSSGNVDPTYDGPVTLSLAANPGGSTLGGTLTASAVNGVATFTNVTIDKPDSGTTLKATATGLASSTTTPFGVVPATAATQLVVTSQPPASVTAGVDFGVVVMAENSKGTVDTSFDGSVTIADPSGALGGTLTVNAVKGVATFNGLSIDLANTSSQLTVTAAGLAGATTSAIAVTPGLAVQLVVPALSTTLVSGTAPGGPLPTILTRAPFAIQVFAEDPYGNVDPNFNGSVTLALGANPGGATLGGTLNVNLADGVAAFTGLSISAPGSGYTLQATSFGLSTGSGPLFNVTNDQLVVTTQPPSSVTAGDPLGLVVEAENAQGAVDSTFIGSVTVADPSFGQTLAGTTTVTAAGGVATFSGLTLSQADSLGETLIATSGNLPAAISNTLDVVPGTATQLAVQTAPPSAVSVGSPLEVDVAVEDAQGNVETAFNGNVTLALANNPSGATLGGTRTVAAVNGVAAFPSLTLSKAGSGITLQATSPGLSLVTTGAIRVSPAGVATQLVVTAQPPSSFAAGSKFGLTVKAEDSFGTVDKTFKGSVTLSSPSVASLTGTLSVTAAGGVATFSGLTDDLAGSGITLSATSTGLDPATTNSFAVTPLAAAQLAVSGPYGNVFPGSAFGVSVLAEDQYGNVDPTFSGSEALALQTNPSNATLGGPLTATAAGGQATFPGLTINKLGSGYTLKATGAGMTVTSASFDVTADELAVTSQPPGSVSSGTGFGLTVAAQNVSGNVDTTFTGSVTVALIDLGGTGATLGGTLTATAVGGVATFSGLTLNQAGNYMLTVTASGAGGTVTSPVAVVGSGQLPTVSAVAPSSGRLAGGISVTITGLNLTGATKVFFGAVVAKIQSDTATQIVATSPAGKAGTVDVTVVTANGTSATSALDQFTYVAAPTVTKISATAGPVLGGTSVTITGTNLAGATAVMFGKVAATQIESDTATQIVAISPPGTAGAVNVTVVTAGGTSKVSAAGKFTYVALPAVTKLVPAAGPVAGGTLVTITGTNLAGGTVLFGNLKAKLKSVKATQIVAISPAGAVGMVNVTVTTAGGISTLVAADQFTYAAAPTVGGLAPNSGGLKGDTTVTISGTNLAGATAVHFGKVLAKIQSTGATQVVVISPAGKAGTVDVTVTTPGGTSAISSSDKFTYAATGASVLPATAGPTGTRFAAAAAALSPAVNDAALAAVLGEWAVIVHFPELGFS